MALGRPSHCLGPLLVPEGHLICDYRYGLKEAIADGVCRSPRIVLVDNQKVWLTEELETESNVRLFPSIAKLLGNPRHLRRTPAP